MVKWVGLTESLFLKLGNNVKVNLDITNTLKNNPQLPPQSEKQSFLIQD